MCLVVFVLAGCASGRSQQSDLDALNARVSALQGQLSAKDGEISSLQSQMNRQQSSLAEVENEKRRLADRVDELTAEQAARKVAARKIADSTSDLK